MTRFRSDIVCTVAGITGCDIAGEGRAQVRACMIITIPVECVPNSVCRMACVTPGGFTTYMYSKSVSEAIVKQTPF